MSDSVSQVPKDDLKKALDALQNIAKGHNSRGTATTEVESMQDAGKGAGSGNGATQVYHTPSNSDPQGWAGSTARDVPEDGATDSVSENGTDYVAQSAGLMKSVLEEKIAKGEPLTASEAALYAHLSKGTPPFMKKDDDEDDDEDAKKAKSKDDDDDDDMGKSLTEYAQENDDVSKGLEVSEFLAGFADVVSKSLEAMESRIVSRVTRTVSSEAQSSGEFQKSLAEAVGRLGEAVTATAQRVDQVESQPAHAPQSVQNVHALEKGNFGGPATGGDEPLSKALVAATLVDLVQKGEASAQDVLKYDSSGTLSPATEAKVRAALGSGR